MSVVSFPPSGLWSDTDGTWSKWALLLGSERTQVYVDIATNLDLVYAVDARAPYTSAQLDSRGGTFDVSQSTTWFNATPSLSRLEGESTVGYNQSDDVGHYGFDNVALGFNGEQGPTLGKQVIATYITPDYWRGQFGLLPAPFNFSSGTTDPYPSYIATLKNDGKIGSSSFGFTAGARYYYNSGVQGSLTLGGYDTSRFRNDIGISLPMYYDNQYYMTTRLDSISVDNLPNSPGLSNALSAPISVSLDSALPYVYLPTDACERIASTIGLSYNASSNLYFIPRTVDDGFGPSITQTTISFTLGDPGTTAGQTIKITLPYKAFNQSASAPFAGQTDSNFLYFPMRRGNSSDQYRLGRVFFQEAYVIADFERNNFSVHQAVFDQTAQSNLVPIKSPSDSNVTVTHPPSSGTNAGAIAGGVVGGVVGALLIVGLLWLWMRRRAKKRAESIDSEKTNFHNNRAGELASQEHPDIEEMDGGGSGRPVFWPGGHSSPPHSSSPLDTPRTEPEMYEMFAPHQSQEAVEMAGSSPHQHELESVPESGAVAGAAGSSTAVTTSGSRKNKFNRSRSRQSHRSIMETMNSGGETDQADDEASDIGHRRPDMHARHMSAESTGSVASAQSMSVVSPASVKIVSHSHSGSRGEVSSDSEPEALPSISSRWR